MKKPLLSVVVPTKNRYQYLKELILLVKSFNQELLELVIQDNSDDNSEILTFIEQNSFEQLKYFYRKDSVDMVLNADLAVLNSTGEYVCFIGDDDGVTRNIVNVVEQMIQCGYDAVRPIAPSYIWPDVQNAFWSFAGSVKCHKKYSGRIIPKDVKKALRELLSRGGQYILDMPCVYHGIVKRKYLNEIYNITGSFFPGPSPDMANAVSLALLDLKFGKVDAPVIISGQGKKSAGGKGASHKHLAEIKDVKSLPEDTDRLWDKRVPKYWTGETIYAETVLKSLERMERQDIIPLLNLGYFYGTFVVFHFSLIQLVKPYLRLGNVVSVCRGSISVFSRRVKAFISNFFLDKNMHPTIVLKRDINSIIDCEKYLFNLK